LIPLAAVLAKGSGQLFEMKGFVRPVIVDPDFLDHWKTRMLVGNLNDEAAPIYVLRLWAHCQNRRQSEFESLSTEALKALCRFPGPANKLEASLSASGFVRREGDSLIVCNWDEYNSSLIASWNNGKLGGRPKKIQPKARSEPTHKPTGNPRVTSGVTDERGEDQRGEDKNSLSNSACEDSKKELPRETHLANPQFQQVWDRWCRHQMGIGKSVSAASTEQQLYKLADFDETEAIEIVLFSLERSAKNLILNGDHRRTDSGSARPRGGKRAIGMETI
jgi:hypothetical protein